MYLDLILLEDIESWKTYGKIELLKFENEIKNNENILKPLYILDKKYDLTKYGIKLINEDKYKELLNFYPFQKFVDKQIELLKENLTKLEISYPNQFHKKKGEAKILIRENIEYLMASIQKLSIHNELNNSLIENIIKFQELEDKLMLYSTDYSGHGFNLEPVNLENFLKNMVFDVENQPENIKIVLNDVIDNLMENGTIDDKQKQKLCEKFNKEINEQLQLYKDTPLTFNPETFFIGCKLLTPGYGEPKKSPEKLLEEFKKQATKSTQPQYKKDEIPF